MTRLLFLPDETTLILLESPLDPDHLIHSIQNNLWQPPSPYREGSQGGRTRRLQAIRLGDIVVVGYQVSQRPERVRRRGGGLSRRQLQVLKGLAEGLTSRQIAARLKIHPGTIEHHVNAIKARLGTGNRAESISKASALGLICEEENF
ncbi:MAG: helix-turn-helix transcriptional regulator [Anaerolineae bacterium]|nr:helix-turn-helix transcriptional regulator [Anaerolineae bacterium]